MTGEVYVDAMYFRIFKEAETAETVDYAFKARMYGPDPQRPHRNMDMGEARGLLRIDKHSLDVSLVSPMWGDESRRRFLASAAKVLKDYRQSGQWPEETHFACG